MAVRGIEENIKRLEDLCREFSSRNRFSQPQETNLVYTVETGLGIFLPQTYRDFIRSFNGGMFLEHNDSFYIDMTDWEPDGPKYSNFYFFSLDELVDKYEDIRYSSQLISLEPLEISPIIPICSTPDQELIVLLTQKDMKMESPVFIIKDIEDMSTYYELNDSFLDFFENYLNNECMPDLGNYEKNRYMSTFIHDNGLHNLYLMDEEPDDKLMRLTYMLKLRPDDPLHYCNRGNLYLDMDERKLALVDYNKAVDLDPESAFARYCRGDLLYEYGSARKALIDMDIAVKLSDNDHFYLTGRAKVFLKLKKLKQALTDCNTVLDANDTDILALTTRYRVYGELGEHEKAEADNAKLEELYGE